MQGGVFVSGRGARHEGHMMVVDILFGVQYVESLGYNIVGINFGYATHRVDDCQAGWCYVQCHGCIYIMDTQVCLHPRGVG